MNISILKSKNVKIVVVLIIIVGIIFIYLLIRKKHRRKENFENPKLCLKSIDTELINKFRIDMGFTNDITKIQGINFNNFNKNIIESESDYDFTINYRYDFIQLENPEITRQTDEFLITPTGVIFDSNNDDIIIFDIYKLRRFQYRLNRTSFKNYEEFNNLINLRNNLNDSILSDLESNPRYIEILSEFELKRELLFIYLLIYSNETDNLNLKRQLNKLEKNNIDNGNREILDTINILKDEFYYENTDNQMLDIVSKLNIEEDIEENENDTKQIVTIIDDNLSSNSEKIKILTGFKDGLIPLSIKQVKKEIAELLKFLKRYKRFKDCRNNAILNNRDENRYNCSIKYQEDLPRFNLGKEYGKGIESLNYDKGKKAPLFDNRMNPMSNSWREDKYNGIFEPIKSYRDKRVYNAKGTKGVLIKDAVIHNTALETGVENDGIKGGYVNSDNNIDMQENIYQGNNLLFEPFENRGLTNIKVDNDKSAGFFVLPDELDIVGVKMCLYTQKNDKFIFVPDMLNNRIQIFSIDKGAEFNYKGEFGNLDFTSYRSLPTYQGEKVADIYEPIKNTAIMYEPIHNMEIFESNMLKELPTYCKETCRDDDSPNCYLNLKKKLYSYGPVDHEDGVKDGVKDGVNECITEYSTRRANIHQRQKDGNDYIKKGHFYNLFNEYERIKNYFKRDDITGSGYANPFNLVDGAEVCMGKFEKNCIKTKDPYNGVKECSLAYRKFLLKVIKETNEGQKYGQLFRPKSVTYDSDSDLFYVADTYHHCIQCFRVKESGYSTGKKLIIECPDSEYNEGELYCYDNDWNYNLSYNSSPIYSLGLRQQILHKSVEERKNDLDKQTSIYPGTELKIPPSQIEDDWVKKYAESDGKVRLYRWVSGTTNVTDYQNIEANEHYFFNTSLINSEDDGKQDQAKTSSANQSFLFNTTQGGDTTQYEQQDQAKTFPGVGEFLYPADLVFVSRLISPVENNDLLLVTDTGNNRVSIFKKYLLDIDTKDKYRFRFYRFLGDKEDNDENKEIINPIGITVNPANGSILVLQGNMQQHSNRIYQKSQSIKVFIPKKDENGDGHYKFSHSISLKNSKQSIGDKDPRFTKIEVDKRGIILLTDINNRRVHILRENIGRVNLEIEKINSDLVNKVVFNINFNPNQGISNIFSNFNDRYIASYNRFRFLIERYNISTKELEPDMLLSEEYNHNYFENNNLFVYEDKYERLKEKGFWYINDKNNIIRGSANNLESNISKNKNKYNNLITDGVENWQGNPMSPNTSYRYKIYLFNYHSIKPIMYNGSEEIEINTHPLNVPDENIFISNVTTKKENYLNFRINYSDVSLEHGKTAKNNPLCVYLIRGEHNRTRNGLLKYLNLKRHNMIQLIVPNASKYIYNKFSKPKFGKLYVYDITKAQSPLELTSDDLLTPSQLNLYQNNKYIIFYSAEGGNIKENGKILPTSASIGLDYIEDFFTLGDDPLRPHTKIIFQVKIDIRESNKEVIMLSDNDNLENKLLHYRKDRIKKDNTSLELIKKYPIAQEIDNFFKNEIFNYDDKGVIKNDELIPLPLNKTLEYSIFIGNQYKINPSCTTINYTTRPEKPYIKDISKVEVTQGGIKASKIKIEWYYTQNKNLYWPVNFLIMRIPSVLSGGSIPIIKESLDFTKGTKEENDKFFNIESDLVSIIGGDIHTFEKTFKLDGKREWKITFFGFNNIENMGNKEIFVNGVKFFWNVNNKSHIFTGDSVRIKVELDGSKDEYLNKVIIEEYINVSTVVESPSETSNYFKELIQTEYNKSLKNKKIMEENAEILKQKYINEIEEEYNEKFIQAVEAYRQYNNIGFYFNLQDDYNGYYTSVTDNYSGKSGQLYHYLKSQDVKDLYKIFDELHDKIKIYHGEATMTIDGPNGMLRSGGKDAIIEKIRYLSFMLKEATKTENKSLGIICKEQDLSDIFQEKGFEGVIKCFTEEKAKKIEDINLNAPIASPEILDDKKINELTSNFELEKQRDFISYDFVIVEGEKLQSVLEKFDEGGIWEKGGINNVVYDLEKHTTKLIKEKVSENTNNIIFNSNTILLWRRGEKDLANQPVDTTDIQRIKPYEILKQDKEIKKLGSYITDEDRKDILENYAIPPTPVSLSSQQNIPGVQIFKDMDIDVDQTYSVHTHYLPAELDQQYAYKIACFQNGHSLNSQEKKNYLGINVEGSELGFGEVYSDISYLGQQNNLVKQENNLEIVNEIVTAEKPKEVLEPVIKYFNPKSGNENTVIQIVGNSLDKFDYFVIRDIKVDVIKKQKRIIVENGKEISYDEYLIKPPTIKQLNRECWQTYEPYKVLVYGYFKGTGKQIVSSERGADNKMFTYLNSSTCPNSNKEIRKYAPS